jgi:uracil-DNA glycosylase
MDLLDIIEDTIHTNWKPVLINSITSHQQSLHCVLQHDTHVFPENRSHIFRAFQYFDCEQTRAVILGQDCYQSRDIKTKRSLANGLCFGVPVDVRLPPSLRNIFRELQHEYPTTPLRTHGDLEGWARQGVLLLNRALTVREDAAGSHLKVWKPITEAIIRHLATSQKHVVYMLWGNPAKEAVPMIPSHANQILTHTHPSPLARKPFVGNNHFRLCNEYLREHGRPEIQWLS